MSDWTYKPAGDQGLPRVAALKSLKREPGLLSRGAHSLCSSCCTVYLKGYHRLEIKGRDNLPVSLHFTINQWYSIIKLFSIRIRFSASA